MSLVYILFYLRDNHLNPNNLVGPTSEKDTVRLSAKFHEMPSKFGNLKLPNMKTFKQAAKLPKAGHLPCQLYARETTKLHKFIYTLNERLNELHCLTS